MLTNPDEVDFTKSMAIRENEVEALEDSPPVNEKKTEVQQNRLAKLKSYIEAPHENKLASSFLPQLKGLTSKLEESSDNIKGIQANENNRLQYVGDPYAQLTTNVRATYNKLNSVPYSFSKDDLVQQTTEKRPYAPESIEFAKDLRDQVESLAKQKFITPEELKEIDKMNEIESDDIGTKSIINEALNCMLGRND